MSYLLINCGELPLEENFELWEAYNRLVMKSSRETQFLGTFIEGIVLIKSVKALVGHLMRAFQYSCSDIHMERTVSNAPKALFSSLVSFKISSTINKHCCAQQDFLKPHRNFDVILEKFRKLFAKQPVK